MEESTFTIWWERLAALTEGPLGPWIWVVALLVAILLKIVLTRVFKFALHLLFLVLIYGIVIFSLSYWMT
jgi:hypothetical protein